jgi:hypothetical protein
MPKGGSPRASFCIMHAVGVFTRCQANQGGFFFSCRALLHFFPRFVQVSSSSYSDAHICTPMLTFAHQCSRSPTNAHVRIPMLMFAYQCLHSHSNAHVCIPMLMFAYQCLYSHTNVHVHTSMLTFPN